MIFGIEFVLIYQGLLLTSASRAVVFLYTAPFFVALGSYVFLGERLRASQWAGLGLSFAGVALAIGVPQANVDASVLFGDLLIVAGGSLWAATTLIVKATPLIRAPAEKGLGYQVAISIPILAVRPGSRARRITHIPSAAVAVAAGLSGVLGGRADIPVVVCAGEDLFGQQTVRLHLHHAAVRRGRELFHPARHADASPSASRRCWSSRGSISSTGRKSARAEVAPDPNVSYAPVIASAAKQSASLRRDTKAGLRTSSAACLRGCAITRPSPAMKASMVRANPSRSAAPHPSPIRPSSRHRA